MQPVEGKQHEIDFVRGEQLRLLRDCELPKRARDKTGKGVSAIVLKSVLKAIDDYGRGRAGGCTAAVSTLAVCAGVSRRQCVRALEVLTCLGLVCNEGDASRWGHVGSPTNARTIVWSELALLVDHGPLARQKQSALGADQSALGADQSALGADQSAPRGTQSASKRSRSAIKAPSDVGGDGARKTFFGDEIAAVRAKANTLNQRVCARTLADRELVLKVATLWHEGQLSDDMVEQVLESYARKADAGDPVKNPIGWFWGTLRGQCQRHGVRLELLLARTDFPRELLAPRPLQLH